MTLLLGDAGGEPATTVGAETLRLMLESVHTARGELKSPTFTVMTCTP